jgi:hypothetical protein
MRRYAIVTVIAVVPIAILCAYVANLLAPTSPLPRPASYDYVPTASIINDSETIGIADSDIYGLSLPNGQLDKAAVDQHFADMKALGVTTVRVLIPWAGVEPLGEASTYRDWSRVDYIVQAANAAGMSVLGVLNATAPDGAAGGNGCFGCVGAAPDPTKYAAFAAEAATHLKGLVSAYEVWNEPNAATNWLPGVDPVAYTNVLKAAYTAIKGADPNAMVVAGVLGAALTVGNLTMDPRTFVQTMYANGAKGFFDALSFHPYSYQQEFSQGLGCQFCQNTPITMLLQIRQTMLDNMDGATKIWASEYGLGTSIASYQQQADWIKDFLTTWADGPTGTIPAQYQDLVDNWTSWIGPAFIYTLRDRITTNPTESSTLGLFYYDSTTGTWKMKCGDEGNPDSCAAQIIKDLIAQRSANNLAAALAASLQKLVTQVATSIQTTVQNAVVPAVQQTAQQIGASIGNALKAALAAWAASFKKTPATTPVVAAIESVDTTAAAETAVTQTFRATAASTGAEAVASEEVSAADEPAAEKDSAASVKAAASTENDAMAPADEPKASSDEPKASTDEPKASTEPASEEPKTSDQPVASDDPKTTDDVKATAPANRKDEDEATGDVKKDDDKKTDGDKDADGATSTGKHAKGAHKHGKSVDEIKSKVGDKTAKTTKDSPKHAAAEASAAG